MLAKRREPELPGVDRAPSPESISRRPVRHKIVDFPRLPTRLPERRAADLTRRLAEACLEELSGPYRDAIRLRDVEGLSTVEVAARLSLARDLAAARIEHARRLLAQAVCRRCRPSA